MKFYDREEEMKILLDNEMQSRDHAMFTVLMGRRRIGKTSLLLHSLKGTEHAYLFVSKDNESLLCQKFRKILEESLHLPIYGTITNFRDLFEIIMKESEKRHFTVVLDEFQNLYTANPAIFSEIQDIWDRYHATSRLNLIACGSIHSLMKRIFEDKSEPLYGRPSSKFILHPFRLSVIKQILSDSHPEYSSEDLLCLYMLTGGVAKYLELLVDGGNLTKKKMLDAVCRQDSYFLSEGFDLINNEFQRDYSTYFSILQLIASGMTQRTEIDGVLQKSMGVYLKKLENDYEMISRQQPLKAKPGSKITRYQIKDPFLRFWFRFIYPYQNLIESNQLSLIRENIEHQYNQFTGRTLEAYFQQKAMESGRFTCVGNWWDRKGEKEIDLLALNDFDHTGMVAEIKREKNRISLPGLQKKVEALPVTFHKYYFQFQGLSLEDM